MWTSYMCFRNNQETPKTPHKIGNTAVESNDQKPVSSGSVRNTVTMPYMIPHLGVATLALLPFSNLLPSLIVWFRYRYRDEPIRRNAMGALNFNILYTVAYVMSINLLPPEWRLPSQAIEFWMLLCSLSAVIHIGRRKEFTYPLSVSFFT